MGRPRGSWKFAGWQTSVWGRPARRVEISARPLDWIKAEPSDSTAFWPKRTFSMGIGRRPNKPYPIYFSFHARPEIRPIPHTRYAILSLPSFVRRPSDVFGFSGPAA